MNIDIRRVKVKDDCEVLVLSVDGSIASRPQEIGHAAVVTFRVNVAGAARRTVQDTAQVTVQDTAQVARVLEAARTPKTREELQDAAGIAHREHFRIAYLLPLLSAGWLERTVPDKPRSRLQRYRTTEAGREAVARAGG